MADGTYMNVSPKDVKVGERIEVKPGGRVPLDGVLLEAEAQFDTSALTGESMPRSIREGEEVLAGMIVQGAGGTYTSESAVRAKCLGPYFGFGERCLGAESAGGIVYSAFRTDLYPNRDSSVVSNRVGSSLGRDGDAFFPVCFLGLVI